MIRYIGSISGIQKMPYIYLILKGSYLYIGETQRIPVKRWGEHMRANGSFTKALTKHDIEMVYRDDIIYFYGYACEKISSDVESWEWRKVTQFVEHMVHVKIHCHPLLGPKYTVISDTTRTTPRRCRYSWSNMLAEEIVTDFNEKIYV